ncbi:telomere repeats-binding bouquet formation protein 2 isoform X2 [Cheilinus undulatus]|nr:telomere repeats-binding bouquet formation protein 2 isoform X2 [Cheilinus undulatus]
MFKNRSAWFSGSVPRARQNIWILEGGIITNWRKADYIFSEDAACPDTQRIFQSKEYLWNKVVVFHSLFLSVCEKRQSVKSVSIGHYVLPPASVQEEVRKVVGRFIWESDIEQPEPQASNKVSRCKSEDENSEETRSYSEHSDTESSEGEAPLSGYCINRNKPKGYISMDHLQKYSGDLHDFHSGCFQCSNCKAHCCLKCT